jgi:hypothetical protein
LTRIKETRLDIECAIRLIERVREFGPTTARMEFDFARVYASAIATVFQFPDLQQTEMSLTDYREGLLTALERAAARKVDARELEAVLLFLKHGPQPPWSQKWKEDEAEDFISELREDPRFPNVETENHSTAQAGERWEDRLVDLLQDILPTLLQPASTDPRSAG